MNEIRRNITAVKDNLPFLSNLPLETRNDMAEYNLKTKNALRLIVKDQNKIFEEKEITIRFATSYDLKFIKENYEKLSKSNEVFYSSITNNDDEPKYCCLLRYYFTVTSSYSLCPSSSSPISPSRDPS